ALAAQRLLAGEGIAARVVSMPCQELFASQSQEYRDGVLPPGLTARVAVEAGHPVGWVRFVGDRGRVVALERGGASAPYEVIYEKLGLTTEAVAQAARDILGG